MLCPYCDTDQEVKQVTNLPDAKTLYKLSCGDIAQSNPNRGQRNTEIGTSAKFVRQRKTSDGTTIGFEHFTEPDVDRREAIKLESDPEPDENPVVVNSVIGTKDE